jgi:hypothetical protein
MMVNFHPAKKKTKNKKQKISLQLGLRCDTLEPRSLTHPVCCMIIPAAR